MKTAKSNIPFPDHTIFSTPRHASQVQGEMPKSGPYTTVREIPWSFQYGKVETCIFALELSKYVTRLRWPSWILSTDQQNVFGVIKGKIDYEEYMFNFVIFDTVPWWTSSLSCKHIPLLNRASISEGLTNLSLEEMTIFSNVFLWMQFLYFNSTFT